MDFIKSWALGVCACAIVGAVFSMLAPKGKMDKILKLMISVFILTSMVTPFLSGEKIDFDFSSAGDSISVEELQKSANEIMLKTAKSSAENAVEAAIKSIGIKDYSVDVTMTVDENNNVIADGVTVSVRREDLQFSDEIILCIKEKLDMKAQVLLKEESYG